MCSSSNDDGSRIVRDPADWAVTMAGPRCSRRWRRRGAYVIRALRDSPARCPRLLAARHKATRIRRAYGAHVRIVDDTSRRERPPWMCDETDMPPWATVFGSTSVGGDGPCLQRCLDCINQPIGSALRATAPRTVLLNAAFGRCSCRRRLPDPASPHHTLPSSITVRASRPVSVRPGP